TQSPAAAFTLAAGSKRAFLLGDVVPQTQTRTTDGGFVFVRTKNAVPIFGLELFFLRSGLVYANVPGSLLLGVGFPPPGSTQTGNAGPVTTDSVFTGDGNQVSKTSFRPGDTITFNIRVNNSTGSAATVTRRYLGIGPSGYAIKNDSFSGTVANGLTIRFMTGTVPADAPAGTYTFTG